jgi:hypothetical protein
MKLIDQYNHIKDLINIKEQEFVDEFFKNENKPEVIFSISGWKGGIIEKKVTGFRALDIVNGYQPSINGLKPTKKFIAELLEYQSKYTPSVLMLDYEETSNGYKSSGAIRYHEIGTVKQKNTSFNREKLEPILQEMIQKYAPKEGHFACSYCQKQTPNEQKVTHKIFGRDIKQVWNSWKNRHESKAYVTEKYMDFCSGTCAGNEQMAREG